MKQDKMAELSLAFGIEIMRLSHWLEQKKDGFLLKLFLME